MCSLIARRAALSWSLADILMQHVVQAGLACCWLHTSLLLYPAHPQQMAVQRTHGLLKQELVQAWPSLARGPLGHLWEAGLDPLDPLFLENINDPTARPVRSAPSVSDFEALLCSNGSVARTTIRISCIVVCILRAKSQRTLLPQADMGSQRWHMNAHFSTLDVCCLSTYARSQQKPHHETCMKSETMQAKEEEGESKSRLLLTSISSSPSVQRYPSAF